MFYYFHVWLVDENNKKLKHIDTVQAVSKKSAEENVLVQFGSASRYTVLSGAKFLAEKC